MNIHFIAIGGSAMHNLAIALLLKGYHISGSDDEIFDPAQSRLRKYGLLPEKTGWYSEKITQNLDAVILGMHACEDNPELIRAKELNIKIFSYPEFLYEQSKDKLRIVVGGSHGKTTITSMIIHAMQYAGMACDYMVGAQLEGFEVMVKLTENAEIMVIEGDEYLTSPIDRRPKFHLYRPHIGIISGIAWDHINVFPAWEIYVEQFRIFAEMIEDTFIYCKKDNTLNNMSLSIQTPHKIAYAEHPAKRNHDQTVLETEYGEIPLQIFGIHNLENLNAAKHACLAAGMKEEDFYQAIMTFKGASKRLEKIAENTENIIFKDFAHSPSKLKASIHAVKEQFPEKRIVACVELHTFSSLNEHFIKEYTGSMDEADIPLVYYNHHAIKHKKLPPLSSEIVFQLFNNQNLKVFTDTQKLLQVLYTLPSQPSVFLLMSSGDFNGLNLNEIAQTLL